MKMSKKTFIKEVKKLSEKDKIKMIVHLMGQVEHMRQSSEMQFQVIASLMDSKIDKNNRTMQ